MLERLDPEDAARFWMGTPKNPMVITAIIELDGPLDVGTIAELVRERMLVHERLRMRPVWSGIPFRQPRWRPVDPTSLEPEVERVVIDASAGEASLAEVASRLASFPLDPRKPPWRLWVVDREGGPSSLVVRIHHVVADGVALLGLLFGFSDEGAGASASIPPARIHATAPLGGLPSRLRAAARVALAPSARRLGRGSLHGRRRMAWTDAIDLGAVRNAARARSARVNDLLIAAAAGAVRRVGGPSASRGRFVAMVPVALEHHEAALENRFASLMVRLPTWVDDAGARVSFAQEAMKRALESGGVARGRALLDVGVRLGGRIERLGVRYVSRKASLVLSNLVGPPSTLHVAGRRITSMLFAAPSPGSVPLSLSAFSYAGALRVTASVDDGRGVDARSIARALEDELGLLL